MTQPEKIINLYKEVGTFAENKDKARDIRTKQILPALENNESVILDFQDVDLTTQSFIHALISDVIRTKGIGILDKLYFRNCNEIIKTIIGIVVDYLQDPSMPPSSNKSLGADFRD